jgi:cobalamin biosynthesis Mg chelatase CobN
MSTDQDPPASERSSRTNDPLVAPRESAAAGGSEVESAPASEEGLVSAQASPGSAEHAPTGRAEHEPSRNMLPGRERRRSRFERLIVRLIATGGVIAIGVAIAAIMVSSNSQGWVVGLVVSIVTVILSGLLWSSKQL